VTVLLTVLPTFALILAGFGFARLRGLGEEAVTSLNLYVVWLALPALLFDFLAEAKWATLDQPRFVAVFAAGMVATFALSLLSSPALARGGRRPLARRSLDALTASYANTAYMGIPIASALLGDTGLAAAVIASLLTVCALFALSITLVEIDLARGSGTIGAIGRVAVSVLRNPLVAAPLAGAAWAATGVAVPAAASGVLKMLAASATPVALVTIGVFLAERRGRGQPAELGAAVLLKLVAQPVLTLMALLLMPLAPPWRAAALLLAALPTGTGPFMVAQLYGQEVTLAARATLVSTVLSFLTVGALAWWLTG